MAKNSLFKIVVADKIAEEGINIFQYDPRFRVVVIKKGDSQQLLNELVDAHALIVRSATKVTSGLLEKAHNLKIVGRAGAGYDNIDVDACTERNIVVMITPGANSNGVVELTIALMFALVRHIPKADSTMKSDQWEKKQLAGTELKGKTLGLVGLGRIGANVAVIAQALGMKLMALVKNKNKKRKIMFNGEFVDSLDDLLPNVDFISLHVPLSEKTKGMIGEKELAKMKPSAYLINTSRGAVVDEKALYNALKENQIAGAAIDVYSHEPASMKDYPFIGLDNVIATPHLGASTKESQANVSRIIADNVIEALTTSVYLDAVNLPFNIPNDEAKTYRPYILLANTISRFAGNWITKEIKEIHFTYRFRDRIDFKPLMLTACAQVLNPLYPHVSMINVQEFLDKHSIGIMLKQSQRLEFDNSFKIGLVFKEDPEFNVRGVISGKNVPKIVEIMDQPIEFVPREHMLIIENKNVPGVVGLVGSVLGKYQINIAHVHLSEAPPESTVHACFILDQIPQQIVLDQLLSKDNILAVKMLEFSL